MGQFPVDEAPKRMSWFFKCFKCFKCCNEGLVYVHECTVTDLVQYTSDIPIREGAGWCEKLSARYRSLLLMWRANPYSHEYYRNDSEFHMGRQQHIARHKWMIHPFSKFRAGFEVVMILVYLVTLIRSPYTIAFTSLEEDTEIIHYSRIPDLLDDIPLIINVFINFFTGYVIPTTKTVVLDGKKIAFNYIFSLYFAVDVIVAIPEMLQHLLPLDVHYTVNLVQLIMIVRVGTLLTYMQRATEIFCYETTGTVLMRHLIFSLLFFHYCTCFYYGMTSYYDYRLLGLPQPSPLSWLYKEGLSLQHEEDDPALVYFSSWYRTMCLLLDITVREQTMYESYQAKRQDEETLLEIFIVVVGKMYWSWIIVLLVQRFRDMRNLSSNYNEVMSEVTGYLNHNRISPQARDRIQHFYEYKYNRKIFEERTVNNVVSESIKKEISYCVHSRLIKNVKLFADIPKEALKEILTRLQPEIYLPMDVIIKAGDVGDCMYFLSRGTVTVLTPSGREVCHLHDGSHFGEISLVTKNKIRTATIVAIEYCEVYRLDRNAFKASLSSQGDALEQLSKIAEERWAETEDLENFLRSRELTVHQ